MKSTLAYFSQQGLMSDPGNHISLFNNLPTSTPDLVKLVQGITIHVFWMERYGFKAPPERMAELQLRTMEKRLTRTLELDPRPLTEPRSIEKKLIGNCRDHSLLLASMLRHQGIPARARCGFGVYFLPDHFEDHWVVEYWNTEQNRWVFVDAQLDELQQDAMKISFDVLDVPRDQFIVAGKAWQCCAGEQDPDKFGIFDMKGLASCVVILSAMWHRLTNWNCYQDCWGVISRNRSTTLLTSPLSMKSPH